MATVRRGLILAALLLASCRSTETVLPLEEVVPPGTADFALDPIPTPREADLDDRVAVLGRVHATEPSFVDCLFLLEPVLPPRDQWVPSHQADTVIRVHPGGSSEPESFQLSVALVEGGVEVVLGAADRAGQRWAAETLRQLIVEKDGVRYIRLGTIRDRPGFPLRGSKRPLTWEHRYRANLGWENPGPEVFVATLSPGGVLDVTEAGLARARRFFIDEFRGGARHFAIEFDDVGFQLTPRTRDLYGSYFFALTAYLRACREMVRKLDPEAVLYWLPQVYWTKAREFEPFATQVGLAGGAPPDLGLVLTGPEVISAKIPAAAIARARHRLGLTATKTVIYDNLGREGDHGPLTGRGADLLAVADGVFGERGEVLNRITRLDYSWNPGAYDPERSHLLACREVVGAAAARDLHRLVMEIDTLAPDEAVALFCRVEESTPPDPRAPVDRAAYLAHLRAWLMKSLNVDPSSESP